MKAVVDVVVVAFLFVGGGGEYTDLNLSLDKRNHKIMLFVDFTDH